jgi:hypothetical protein
MAGSGWSGHRGGRVCRHDRQHPSGAVDREPAGGSVVDSCDAPAPQRGGADCGDPQHALHGGNGRHHAAAPAIAAGIFDVYPPPPIGARSYLPSAPSFPLSHAASSLWRSWPSSSSACTADSLPVGCCARAMSCAWAASSSLPDATRANSNDCPCR